MTVTISRLYNSYAEAREAVLRLEATGVKHGDISVVASNADNWYSADRKAGTFPDRDLDRKDDRSEAAGTGASVGAAVGGAAGLLVGLGLIAIPGVGPVVAAGWLAATLTGAVTGGATGGIIGALTQAGVGKEEADLYAEGLRRGEICTEEGKEARVLDEGILVAVRERHSGTVPVAKIYPLGVPTALRIAERH